MKKFNGYEYLFSDFKLTDLMTIKNGKKKGLGDNTPTYAVLSHTLKDYGINLFGNWVGLEGIEVRHSTLDKKFPKENFPILIQMYGWNNANIYICLERTEYCEYGFYFNTETLKIRLVEMRWGDIKKDCFYDSFAEFWAERKIAKKKYDKMLPKEDKE